MCFVKHFLIICVLWTLEIFRYLKHFSSVLDWDSLTDDIKWNLYTTYSERHQLGSVGCQVSFILCEELVHLQSKRTIYFTDPIYTMKEDWRLQHIQNIKKKQKKNTLIFELVKFWYGWGFSGMAEDLSCLYLGPDSTKLHLTKIWKKISNFILRFVVPLINVILRNLIYPNFSYNYLEPNIVQTSYCA